MTDVLKAQDVASQIYLDANATTPVLPRIADVVSHTMQVCFGNPSSSHITGIQAKHLLEQTRSKARQVIGAASGEILFTSGATEGIQTAVVSTLIAAKNHDKKKPVLLYGATEHKAVPNTLAHWNKVLGLGAEVMAIPVDRFGKLDLDFIAAHVGDALMICTMAVNNETGVAQDLDKLEQVIRAHNPDVAWMVDCVQALGKKALALSDTTIDYAPFSGHKLYAPKGIGVLYIRQGSPYTPFIAGGGQEGGMRSGTENLPGIAGLNELFSLLNDAASDVFKSHDTLEGYRRALADALEDTFGKITFHHRFEDSVPTTLNFSVNELTSKEVMDLFDAAGIRVSGGSACSSGANRSFVLDAMGLSNWQSENAIRMSFGPAASEEEIAEACKRIRALKPILAANCLVISDSATSGQEACAMGLTQLRHQGACCWLYVSAARELVVIDPIVELIPRIEKLVVNQGLKTVVVLDTHIHQERISARALLQEILMPDVEEGNDLGWNGPVTLADATLERVATPGHSEDSVSYLLRQNDKVAYCFCGDLILPGGLGNTAIAGGDAAKMYTSLIALAEKLSPDSVICSGHDYQQCFAINWQTQQQQAPLLKRVVAGAISGEEFVAEKSASDDTLQTEKGVLCGYVDNAFSDAHAELDAATAKSKLSAEPDVVLLDIREPYEHDATPVASLFGIADNRVLNMPLSRMADALTKGLISPDNSYVLLCRSGNRSRQAAVNLRLLGFDKAYNLKGGLALLG